MEILNGNYCSGCGGERQKDQTVLTRDSGQKAYPEKLPHKHRKQNNKHFRSDSLVSSVSFTELILELIPEMQEVLQSKVLTTCSSLSSVHCVSLHNGTLAQERSRAYSSRKPDFSLSLVTVTSQPTTAGQTRTHVPEFQGNSFLLDSRFLKGKDLVNQCYISRAQETVQYMLTS